MKMKTSAITLAIVCSVLHTTVIFAHTRNGPAEEIEQGLTKQQRIFGLVTIYRAAKQHFAYFDQVPELDWDQTFIQYLPPVETEQSLLEFYQTLRQFAALLQDGHTYVTLPETLNNKMGNLPLNIDYVEDEWVIIERYPTGEIVKDDVPPGSIILAIEGIPAKKYIKEKVFPSVPGGTFQCKSFLMNKFRFFSCEVPIRLKLRYPDGSIHARTLHAISEKNRVYWDMERFEKYLWPWHYMERWNTETLEDNILYVRFGSCSHSIENKFAELIDSMKPPLPKAIILDLRGNTGGSTPIKTVRHLISRPAKWFLAKTRCSISYADARLQSASGKGSSREEIANEIFEDFPEYSPGWYSFFNDDIEPTTIHYDGPLVLLTDRMTASAAEDLVVILHGKGRAKVIGEATNGSTGQPIFFDLPGGGKVQICTCQSFYPDGRSFVGVGIQPDIPVKRTIQAIAEVRDEVLETALEYIRSNKMMAK